MKSFINLSTVCAAAVLLYALGVDATSMKIDFLLMATVRTDPITDPRSLSAHVHSFFGATEAAPSTKFQDLRNAKGNTGNVKENKSLYWHPTIYSYDKKTKLFTIEKTSVFSAYYIWETGKTTAFPEGIQFIGGGKGYTENSRPYAECVNPGRCPNGDCETWNDFFPATTCDELEMSMTMPSCWNGKDLDSPDHRSHMAYPKNGDPDGDCPPSHPVRLPQMMFFTRIEPYKGGIHVFSDGTGFYHADYMSGWKATFLQSVLDECENESFEAMPTDWCEDFVTFRDTPKNPESTLIDMSKLLAFQPPPFNVSKITTEQVDDVRDLPKPGLNPTSAPTATVIATSSPSTSPTTSPTASPTASPSEKSTASPTAKATSNSTTSPTPLRATERPTPSSASTVLGSTVGLCLAIGFNLFNL